MSIETKRQCHRLLAELALPRNLILKRNTDGIPIGTGPFLVAEWQPAKLLKLAANEDSWEGRPFVDAVEIEFGKSLRDQAIALELDKTDLIEAAPQAAATAPQGHGTSSLVLVVFACGVAGAGFLPRIQRRKTLASERRWRWRSIASRFSPCF